MRTDPDNRITFLGRLNFRDDRRLFGIRRADRRAHLCVIRKTGTGKSTMLETLVRQDMAAGEGLALLDPHGDLAERILAAIPAHRRGDLIWFNVPDTARPLGFNPLETVSPQKRPLAPLPGSWRCSRRSGSTAGGRVWSISCATLCSLCSTSPRQR